MRWNFSDIQSLFDDNVFDKVKAYLFLKNELKSLSEEDLDSLIEFLDLTLRCKVQYSKYYGGIEKNMSDKLWGKPCQQI